MEVTLAPKLLNLGPGGIDGTPVVAAKTAAYTAVPNDLVICNASGGTFTVTLPTAVVVGTVVVAVTAGSKVTVARAGTDTIDGATSLVVSAGEIVTLVSDGGTAWYTANRASGKGGPSVEAVNTVADSGAAQTIPEPGLYGLNDITLTANCTLTFPADSAGKTLRMVIRQDGTGSRTITWPANTIFPGGTDVVPTAAAASIDLIEAVCVAEDVWMVTRIGAAYAV